jgi:hypothetical protein
MDSVHVMWTMSMDIQQKKLFERLACPQKNDLFVSTSHCVFLKAHIKFSN